jgi:SAM-dependent methyltransferase
VKSYTDTRLGVVGRTIELWNLYLANRRDVAGDVRRSVDRMRMMEKTVAEVLRADIRNKNVLVIGPGQRLAEVIYLSRSNQVTGIDLDVIVDGFSPRAYWQMTRENGLIRTVKTIGRKALGVDAAFRRELLHQLGIDGLRPFTIIRMDAGDLDVPEETFDFVFSRSVFEHLAEPEAVMRETARTLKPGGGAYVDVHLYTSDDGCHDPRIFSGRRAQIPYWAHLRPEHEDKVRPNAYLNRIRLAEWRTMFQRCWPGVMFQLTRRGEEILVPALRQIREQGGLHDFSDDELLTNELVALWRKPSKA